MPPSKELVYARSILDSGEFEKLIGTKEAWDLEYKSELWKMNGSEDKFEFAKDLAGMANSTPGIIVIGISTITLSTSQDDVVNGFTLFDISKRLGDNLRVIADQLIYPQLAIAISARAYHGDSNQGILVIEVPDDVDQMRPYVVTKAPCGKESKNGAREMSDKYFSFPRRSPACLTQYPSAELVDWARKGQGIQASRAETAAVGN